MDLSDDNNNDEEKSSKMANTNNYQPENPQNCNKVNNKATNIGNSPENNFGILQIFQILPSTLSSTLIQLDNDESDNNSKK